MAISAEQLNRYGEYLGKLDELQLQLAHVADRFRSDLSSYQQSATLYDEIDLLSSAAYFEKYILPITLLHQLPQDNSRIDTDSDVLTLGIDQEWRAYEFRQLFNSVDYLNKVYVLREKLNRESQDVRLRRNMTRSYVVRNSLLYYYLAPNEELRVRRVQFASPGSVDFEGSSVALNPVRWLIYHAVNHRYVRDFVRRYDSFNPEDEIRRSEKRMKLKEMVALEREADRQTAIREMEDFKEFLELISDVADLAQDLDRRGLARGVIVEEATIRSLSMLNRFGQEEEKLKLPRPDNK